MARSLDSEMSPDILAKAAVGFGIASIVTILVPGVPLVLGVGAIASASLAKRLRGRGAERGVEGNGVVLGTVGILLGLMMLGFYFYGFQQMRGR